MDVASVTSTAQLRNDVANAVAGPRHAVAALVTNQPLADCNGFPPALLAGNCRTGTTDEASPTFGPARGQAPWH